MQKLQTFKCLAKLQWFPECVFLKARILLCGWLECSNRRRRQIFEVSSPVWPVQIILHFCDNIFTQLHIYRPLGNRLRKSIIAARHVLAIKFASIYSDAYGLSAFELLPCLSWRVLFNLFSYSFTLCSLPVTPFSRVIFIAIYYPSKKKKKKKERERGREEREEKRVEMPSEKEGRRFCTASQALCSAALKLTV